MADINEKLLDVISYLLAAILALLLYIYRGLLARVKRLEETVYYGYPQEDPPPHTKRKPQ